MDGESGKLREQEDVAGASAGKSGLLDKREHRVTVT